MAESTFVAGESSGQNDNNKGSEVELNIKTLDSRIHSFRVNTNVKWPISLLIFDVGFYLGYYIKGYYN